MWRLILPFFAVFCTYAQSVCPDWATYNGATSNDAIKSICRDPDGNIYTAGLTNSSDFQTTPGLISDTLAGDYDGFITKYDSCGALVWSTLIGSTAFDGIEKIRWSSGMLVACGSTLGNDLPVTGDAFQSSNQGNYDIFIAKITASGSLVYCSYFGTGSSELAYGLATDKAGNIYTGGSTNSSSLPVTTQALQQTPGGLLDAFIVSFDTSNNLRWCTYFGGSGSEDVHALECDAYNNLYVAGGTFSQNIVSTANAFQQFNNGGMEIYFLKCDSAGNKLWNTYMGGMANDDCYAIACDSLTGVYIAGTTYSTDFPVSSNAAQDTLAAYSDMFIARFSHSGNFIWSTYYGGSDMDQALSLSVNVVNEVSLLGNTRSPDLLLAGSPVQTFLSGDFDLLLARVDSSGNMMYSSYLGGTLDDQAAELVSAGLNDTYFSGNTYSSDFPVTANAAQQTNNGIQEGLAGKLFLPSGQVAEVNATLSGDNQLQIFPNPASDHLSIQSSQKINWIRISDLNGRETERINCFQTHESEISVQHLKAGLYILTIYTVKKVIRQKFAVSN